MVSSLLKLLLRVLIAIEVLNTGTSYTKQEIVQTAESYCKKHLEEEEK